MHSAGAPCSRPAPPRAVAWAPPPQPPTPGGTLAASPPSRSRPPPSLGCSTQGKTHRAETVQSKAAAEAQGEDYRSCQAPRGEVNGRVPETKTPYASRGIQQFSVAQRRGRGAPARLNVAFGGPSAPLAAADGGRYGAAFFTIPLSGACFACAAAPGVCGRSGNAPCFAGLQSTWKICCGALHWWLNTRSPCGGVRTSRCVGGTNQSRQPLAITLITCLIVHIPQLPRTVYFVTAKPLSTCSRGAVVELST